MITSLSIIGVVALRAAAAALAIAGDTKTSGSMHAVADAIEAGKATDEHLALVAQKLKERDLTQVDWADVHQRIEDDHARLQGS